MPSQHNRLRNIQVTKKVLDEFARGSEQDNLGSRAGDRGDVHRGAPDITNISLDSSSKILTVSIGDSSTVYIEGYRMFDTSNIMLSASSEDIFPDDVAKKYDFFGKYNNRLKTEYPSVNGILIQTWEENNRSLSFNLPVPMATGYIDVILFGPAGYTKASTKTYPLTDQTNSNLINVIS